MFLCGLWAISMKSALLCMLKTNPHDHVLYRMRLGELESLAETAGYTVLERVIQVRRKEAVDYVFGKGKVDELKELVDAKGVETTIFYNILSSKQQYNLEKYLRVRVIDRYDLTLEIFDLASVDELSKLQILWARLVKAFPYRRLGASIKYKIGREHPSFMSLGEYPYHSSLKALTGEIKKVEERIEKQRVLRMEQLENRKRLGVPIICITGYYSAGKTSLFNALTGLNKPIGSKPFTTLSSKYHLSSHSRQDIFYVDTIGFVNDLDPRLIQAFQLTLNDVTASDLVLLVLDISDPTPIMKLRLETCQEILEFLGIRIDRVILVLNKVDRLLESDVVERFHALEDNVRVYPWVLISARERIKLEDLTNMIYEKLRLTCTS